MRPGKAMTRTPDMVASVSTASFGSLRLMPSLTSGDLMNVRIVAWVNTLLDKVPRELLLSRHKDGTA